MANRSSASTRSITCGRSRHRRDVQAAVPDVRFRGGDHAMSGGNHELVVRAGRGSSSTTGVSCPFSRRAGSLMNAS